MSEPQPPIAAEPPDVSIVGGSVAGMRTRYFKDHLARAIVRAGGFGVMAALLLIFAYLLVEVLPLFSSATLERRETYPAPGGLGRTLFATIDELGQLGLRVTADGGITFFDLDTGEARHASVSVGSGIAGVAPLAAEGGELALQFPDGRVLLLRHSYSVSYPDGGRRVDPVLDYPYGQRPLAFMDGAAQSFAAHAHRGTLAFAGIDAQGRVHLQAWDERELAENPSAARATTARVVPPFRADLVLLAPELNWLYAIERAKGSIALYRLDDRRTPVLVRVHDAGAAITDAAHLSGGLSLVLAQADGVVSQWFPARDTADQPYLARVREFVLPRDTRITALAVEQRRRGLAIGDSSGRIHLYYATSGRRVYREQLLKTPVAHLAFSPRADRLLAFGGDGALHGFDVDNPHPEVSLRALWGKVWYESYDEPRWIWQSSSAAADFEPKLSMTPLSLGTLKGAFYAMLFAMPLAVFGAVFTAYFMSPEMRRVVKPSVELLAALPTVILGFLAGLWLAPFVETHLLGLFLLPLAIPLAILLFGYLWMQLPGALRYRVPAGWEAAILIPLVALAGWVCFAVAAPVERAAFGGSLTAWMDRALGIGYDQRNALVVGIAMGVAVIPIVFSIAEDALFSVPRHLTLGSLALGATPWQTLVRVVLPTASPGIFAAVMIGFGRAVGETMIVLMATGNTPVTDFSAFQGMRTLAANVAVEMPESEVGSAHFRLLFLAGLVLFVFTFCFNTLAETVRQRLRRRYGNL